MKARENSNNVKYFGLSFLKKSQLSVQAKLKALKFTSSPLSQMTESTLTILVDSKMSFNFRELERSSER